jgi:hypothetical protein
MTMPEITVWTKQNTAVLEQLEADGRFIADERYIRRELESTTDIMLFIYRWLAEHAPTADSRPSDVEFPVWVSFMREATMKPEPGYVILELRLDEDVIAAFDTAKWTRITNYSYIPEDASDEAHHNQLLKDLGVGNARAVMTQFYPELRSKIIASWDRLFDSSVTDGNMTKYGIIWEVRKEWIQNVYV